MKSLCCIALLGLALTAQADSFTSSASSAASKSVGSVSDSVSQSSESSGGKTEVAAGPYRILALAPTASPGQVELVLAGVAPLKPEQGLRLRLSAELAQAQGLAVGRQLQVLRRAYGLAFAQTAADPPFFVALNDPRDLATSKL